MSTDYNRTLIGSGSIEQVFGGDRNRSFRMSSFVYSWNDVNCFPVYVVNVGGSEFSVSAVSTNSIDLVYKELRQ